MRSAITTGGATDDLPADLRLEEDCLERASEIRLVCVSAEPELLIDSSEMLLVSSAAAADEARTERARFEALDVDAWLGAGEARI